MLIVFVELALHEPVSDRPVGLVDQDVELQLGDLFASTHLCQLAPIARFDCSPDFFLTVELTRMFR